MRVMLFLLFSLLAFIAHLTFTKDEELDDLSKMFFWFSLCNVIGFIIYDICIN